jgi:hypothetical protein
MLAVKRKWILLPVGIIVLILGTPFWISNSSPFLLRHGPRKKWKDRAVTEISRLTGDSAWVASEIAGLTNVSEDLPRSDRWLSSHLILMTNGEWMAYANICRKEDFWIPDLFIGRASDGKWYYSTYHFCIHMIVLRITADMDGQPESVTKFAGKYYLREFDGRSDVCLQRTWP